METKQALTQLTEEIFGIVKEKVDDTNTDLTTHINNKNNPHQVNKTQLGLENVDNTSDANKPISTATQSALNLKEDKSNKVSSFQPTPDNIHYPSEKLVKDNLDDINSKIPSEASSSNQLADKQWVNDNGGKIDTASIDGVNLQVANKNLEIPTVRTDINNQGLTSTQKTNAKTNLDLNNVTNDKQMKGLPSGTTEDHIIVFGEDGYSVKDSGKTLADTGKIDSVSIKGVNIPADASKNVDLSVVRFDTNAQGLDATQKANAKTNLDLNNVANTGDTNQAIENDTRKFTSGGAYTLKTTLEGEISDVEGDLTTHVNDTNNPHSVTKSQVGLGNVTNNQQVKGLASGTTEDNIVTFGIDGYSVKDSGKTFTTSIRDISNATDTVIPTEKATRTALDLKVDKTQIGYFELTTTSGTLTDAQFAEAQKDYCILFHNTEVFYKFQDNQNEISFIKPINPGLSLGTSYTMLKEVFVVNKSTKNYEHNGSIISFYDTTQANNKLALKLATNQVTNVETTTTTSKAYSTGDLLIYNGTLYKVTSAISSGGTITPGTNVSATTIEESLQGKQETLVSGTNIKTINNESVLGSGNLEIEVDVVTNFSNNWSTKTWSGFSEVEGYYIWSDGTNTYYSNDSDQYVLQGDTWVQKVWNPNALGKVPQYGYDIWTDGLNWYYSGGNNTKQYKLNEYGYWVNYSWNGYTSFSGQNIWTDGTRIFISKTSGNIQKILNRYTSTWENVTWSGLSFNPDASNIWTDGEDIYLYNGSSSNYILDKGTFNWTSVTINNLPPTFYASEVWSDGENTYYDYDTEGEVAHLIWNKSTLTWDTHSWAGIPGGIWGSEIWKLGNQIYSSYINEQYVLDKTTHQTKTLEKVAETGDYNDLYNKPIMRMTQAQFDAATSKGAPSNPNKDFYVTNLYATNIGDGTYESSIAPLVKLVYNSNITYNQGEVTLYNGKLYIYTSSTSGSYTPTNTTYWTPLVSIIS